MIISLGNGMQALSIAIITTTPAHPTVVYSDSRNAQSWFSSPCKNSIVLLFHPHNNDSHGQCAPVGTLAVLYPIKL
jgi:hypothetical protein